MTVSMPARLPPGAARPDVPPADTRLAQAGRHAATTSAPLAVGSLAIALASATLLLHASPWRIAWAVAAFAALAAMTAASLAATHPRTPATVARRCERAYAGLGFAAIALFLLAPWLPGPQASPAAAGLCMVALGMAAIGSAAAFAPLRATAPLAAALPLSPALADWWVLEEAATVAPGQAVAGALIGAVALIVGIACRRNWLRDAQALIAGRERIRALEAARDAAVRADRESRRVLAMASQDLRQPVNALGLFAAALEQRLRASGDETLVHDLVRSVDGLDRSLGDMLDLTRLDAVAPGIEHVALAELFQRLATRFAPEASQAGLRLRFACGAKTLDGDADLLERLLAHLVQDALRRTERGGVAVVARTAAGHLHLEVWDTGRGPQDAGAGHALPALAHAIVERLAQRLGYALSAASRPGRGTRVRIAVPAAEPVRPEVPPGCGADAAHGH